MTRLSHWARRVGPMLALVVVTGFPGKADAAEVKPFPPEEKAYGLTLAEWSAAWWQWAASIPKSSNPNEDRTGRYSAVGQRAPVWFLPHSPEAGGTTTRSFLIPSGQALLFAISTTGHFFFNVQTPEETIRAEALDPVETMEASVDGVPLTDLSTYHVTSPLFTALLPSGNVWGAPVPANSALRARSMADGHWILLPPLDVGKHVIKVRVTATDGWSADLTYNLTIADP
jgi:hypothetical protein